MTTTRAPLSLALALAAAVTACSTTASRISNRQALFDSYSTEVRGKIRAGQVALGFNPEQVRMALGEPSRVYTRQTAQGAAEIWSYRDGGQALSFGLGGTNGGGTSVGAGVGIGSGTEALEKLRVTFEAGQVVSLETTQTK